MTKQADAATASNKMSIFAARFVSRFFDVAAFLVIFRSPVGTVGAGLVPARHPLKFNTRQA
jgi:hypothetical protein